MKPGYKQTEIGMIPEDWEVVSLGEIASVKTGPFGSALHAEDYVQSGTPIITVEHLGESCISRQNLPLVSDEDKKRLSAYTLQTGDIVFSRVGSVDRNAYVTEAEDGWLFSGRLLRIRVSDTRCNPKYLSSFFKDSQTKARVREIAVGQTMPSLNTKLLSGFSVCLPRSFEQQFIAEALSDVDELIASLEKLIEKKKAIKQGAMQELLTGKRRLPGFSGEWESVCLSDIGHFIKGSGISRADTNSGKLPAVRYGELYTKHTDYVKKYYSHISCDVAANAVPVTFGAILFAASGETKEEIGKCAAIIEKHTVYAGGDILIFIPDKSTHPVFLGTLLNIPEVCKQKAQRGQGDAIVHIHADSLSEIEVQIPEYDEQAAIADVLLSADREIDLMEMKITKARQVKQGMMQQLLTGAVRLT